MCCYTAIMLILLLNRKVGNDDGAVVDVDYDASNDDGKNDYDNDDSYILE